MSLHQDQTQLFKSRARYAVAMSTSAARRRRINCTLGARLIAELIAVAGRLRAPDGTADDIVALFRRWRRADETLPRNGVPLPNAIFRPCGVAVTGLCARLAMRDAASRSGWETAPGDTRDGEFFAERRNLFGLTLKNDL